MIKFILFTALLMTLSSCSCHMKGDFDCMIDPQDTIKAMD